MKPLIAIAACAALLATYAIGFAVPGFDVYHDDGIYLVTAKALAQGSGYNIISLPEPIAQTKYPPAFPLALAAVWKVFPQFPRNIYVLKIIPFGFAVAWLWLALIYLREKLGDVELAAWIIFLTVASPWVLFSSVAFISETMFAFFLTAAFLVIDRMCRAVRVTWTNVALASTLAAAAILTRTAGLPLIVAGAGALIARRKIAAAVGYASIVCAFISPWWIWSSSHLPARGSFESYYSGWSYVGGSLLWGSAWPQRFDVLETNVAASIISPGALMGVPASTVTLLVFLLLAAFVVYGLALDIEERFTALNLFSLLYAGMLLAYPWPIIRLWIPLLPFLLYFLYLGVADVWTRITTVRSPARTAIWSCAALLLPFACHALFLETQATLRNGSARYPLAEEQKNWPAVLSAMHWVNRNTPPDAVFLGDDPAIFLLTGHPAIGIFYLDPFKLFYSSDPATSLGTPSRFVDDVLRAKVDYVMYESDSTNAWMLSARAQIAQAAADHPAAFVPVRDSGVPGYEIYSVNRPELQAETNRAIQLPPAQVGGSASNDHPKS